MTLKSLRYRHIYLLFTLIAPIFGCNNEKDEMQQTAEQHEMPVAIARGKTDVEGGLISLSFPLDGTVQKILVNEGQVVKEKQILMQQDNRMLQIDKRIAKNELTIAQLQLKSLEERIRELKLKLERLDLAAHAGAAQMQLSDEVRSLLLKTISDEAMTKVQVDIAQSKLNQLLIRGEQLNLVAPVSGTIVKLNTHLGAFLAGQHESMLLLPDKPVIIRAELNESYLTSVKVGMQAKVQIDNDNQIISLPNARVIRISPVFMQSQLQGNNQHTSGRVVECILEFNSTPSTRVGQNVIVSFYKKTNFSEMEKL